MTLPKHFVSCDWGTSSFRLRLVEMSGLRVAAEISGGEGIRSIRDSLGLEPGEAEKEAAFVGFLGERLDELLSAAPEGCAAEHVILSGMATSSLGWRELPYAAVPFALDGSGVVYERVALVSPGGRSMDVFLVSGVATGADIMRGEETELLGILNHPQFRRHARASLVILPGTHSKHAMVFEDRLVNWRTFMTGELFEALTSATILRQTTLADEGGGASTEAQDESFREGVALGCKDGMEATIFQARARAVLDGATNGACRAFLSGALIGSELRHAFDAAAIAPLLIAGSGPFADRVHAAARIGVEAAFPLALASRPEVVRAELPEGAAAIHGHAFLLKRWLGGRDTDR
jgi:2-dehydro-3-deoxygalactonokinase